MGYAILRTQKLKSGHAVRRSLAHAFREQETPNADPERTPENSHFGAANTREALERFNERLATQDKVRSNAVLAVEYLVTASPEDMHAKTREEQDAYFHDALAWLEKRHGKENVIYAGVHRDETTPHMYAYVVPIDERGKLNCRAFLGGAKALSAMQTEYTQEVGQRHGLERGIEGSKARHKSIQQYYARANSAFEPLPQVKTPAPVKLRDEPEKPSLFAGKEAKASYARDLAQWQAEKATHDAQRQKHLAELEAQRNAAVATARRHEAQAKEAQALKREVGELKKSNGHYAEKTAHIISQNRKLMEVAQLFTPQEVEWAQARKLQQDADKARQAQIERQKAAEAARRVEIEAEREKRVQGLQKLLQRGGATHTLAVKAAEALRKAAGDASKVEWSAVEAAIARESMSKHGQSPESVIEAINNYSPGRADPALHKEVVDWVNQCAPEFQRQYQQDRNERDTGPQMRF